MIIEILEGRVTSERWDTFEHEYRKGLKKIPTQLAQNFLIQDIKDKTLWRIISIWQNQASLDEYNTSPTCTTCVEMYRKVGVEPTHRIFNVKGQHMQV